jgi:hypothetical protein
LNILQPLSAQNQEACTCQVLIKWLQRASPRIKTRNTKGNAVSPPVKAITSISFASDKDLILHSSVALKSMIPGIGQPPTNFDTALFQKSNSFVEQRNDQWPAR